MDVPSLGRGQMLLPVIVTDPGQGVVIVQFVMCHTNVTAQVSGQGSVLHL